MQASHGDRPDRNTSLIMSGPDGNGNITISGPIEDIPRTVLELADNMKAAEPGEPWRCTCQLDGREYEIHPEKPGGATAAASYKCYRETGLGSFTRLTRGHC